MLSFIVPAFNEELELPRSLRSIRQAAETTGHRYEIVVVDDSSTDATAALAKNFGARVLPVRCRQIAAVRNAGARAARGDVFFFIDADTCIRSAHISAALAALARGCSGGSALVAMDGDVPWWARLFLRAFSTIYFAANLGVGAFLFTRRETFFAAGQFDERYFAAEETYFSRALKKIGPFTILREPIITSARKVRMHGGGHLLRQLLGITFGGPGALRSRRRLDLWYDGRREQKTT